MWDCLQRRGKTLTGGELEGYDEEELKKRGTRKTSIKLISFLEDALKSEQPQKIIYFPWQMWGRARRN